MIKTLIPCLIVCFLVIHHSAADTGELRRLEKALDKYIEIIKNPDQVIMAKTEVNAVSLAWKRALKSDATIAGYTIVGKTYKLNTSEIKKVYNTAMSAENYTDVIRRCKNNYFIGFKFMRKKKVVDLAIGIPCQQVIWAYPTQNGTGFWGSQFSESATNFVVGLYKERADR